MNDSVGPSGGLIIVFSNCPRSKLLDIIVFRYGVNNYSPNISPGLGGIKQTSEEILIGFAVMLKTRCQCRIIIRERRRRLNDVFISVRARLFD